MTKPQEKTIMTAEELHRMLTRIAHEILERNHGGAELVLLGIPTRGIPLAKRLGNLISDIECKQIPIGWVDIGSYRDDISSQSPPQPNTSMVPIDLHGKRVILVDDVVFTGRSIRAAMDAVIDFGRPQSIQFAVLIDRGHRELPIRPDYVGKNVPSARAEKVHVHLSEIDGYDEVLINTIPKVRNQSIID